jgi:hypothetical protein
MKPLSKHQLIELLPADESTLDAALRRFETAAPVLCREPGYCKQLVAEGWMEASQINWKGTPAFIIAWRVTPDGGFWLELAQALGVGAPFDILVAAIEQLASEKHARYFRFLTMRRGLVRLAQQRGCTPEAVLLTKVL